MLEPAFVRQQVVGLERAGAFGKVRRHPPELFVETRLGQRVGGEAERDKTTPRVRARRRARRKVAKHITLCRLCATMNPAQQVMQVATGYMASSCAVRRDRVEHRRSSRGRLRRRRPNWRGRPAPTKTRCTASCGCSRASASSTKSGRGQFALTPAAELLRKDVPGSLRGMAAFLPDPFHFRVYAEHHALDDDRQAGGRQRRSACRCSSTSRRIPTTRRCSTTR